MPLAPPWLAISAGAVVAEKPTRTAAMRLLDRERWPRAIVKHRRTGETWFRRAGSWFRRERVPA